MATAIGVISGVVGIYQFLADLFPTSPDSVTATVRVAVGLSGTPDPGNPSDTLNDPAGVLGSVRIYNNNQEFLSESQTNVEIDDGGFIDMAVEQVITQQVPYVQIQGADGEDLCIAYTSVTFADGQQRSWDGSWALAYDPLLWFWSGILVSQDSTQTGFCAWLDATAGTYFIYMPAFTGMSNTAPNPDLASYLGAQGLRAYHYNDMVEELQLVVNPENPTKSRRRRRALAKPDNRLVISNSFSHNATELCRHQRSKGPHAVSLSEGMFCDMETRELLPLCSTNNTNRNDCFQLEERRVIRTNGRIAARSDFVKVIDWTKSA